MTLGPVPGSLPRRWPTARPSTLNVVAILPYAGLRQEKRRTMDGTHRFVETQIARAREQRKASWQYDTSSREAYEASISHNRKRLREIIGAVNQRAAPGMERLGDEQSPVVVTETPKYRVFQARWPVLPGVFGEGLLVEPADASMARAVVIPDGSCLLNRSFSPTR